MLHMAFHIGRGEAIGVCPPCLFCGHTVGTCRLQMSKARSGDAHWQIAPTSCAHHCYRKTNMASLQKQVVHNEPLLPGYGRWESRYNMPTHLQVDGTHKEFPFAPEQKAKWEVPEEEKAVLQMALTTWQKQLSTQKSAKEKKRVQEKRHKLKGEVALQREILTKAEKKAARRAEKKAANKAARRAANAGDREAEAFMEAQDKEDKDYQPRSGSEGSESDSSSSGSGSSTSGSTSTTGSSSNRSSSNSNSSARSNSGSSKKPARKKAATKKGKKRAVASEASASGSSSSSKKPAKKKPAAGKGKKQAAASHGGKAKK